jgi:hypothetical protein
MKKSNKDRSPKYKEALKQETVTPATKTEQGDANPNFPAEYEEQRSMDIRMKPQLYVKPEKVGTKDGNQESEIT